MGQFLCHGAAVGSDNGGVLIVGAGGAGKTTTALACLEAGMKYLGDDRCLLSMGEFPHIHSLYGTAKLADIARFPEFEAVIDTNGKQSEEKSLYHLHRLPRSGLHAGFPLRAILMARIENRQETTISSASEARAFLALAVSGALTCLKCVKTPCAFLIPLHAGCPCTILDSAGIFVPHRT
jgi:hypothetical protein